MTFEEQLMQDLKGAMKEKDQASLRGIRALKAAILVRKTDGSGTDISADEYIKIAQKLVKQRKESLDIYEKQNREDLAAVEREEIEVLERYLPAKLEASELNQMIKDIVEEVGATSMKDMGRVMGLANAKAAGRADGKEIATIVKALLQGQ
ncbi:MAG: GatB/YqeY domain-containing protein [Saprospiraceae bacterium]|nr:GatB/YqeY domain-containing protein [Saprospiraceae bacterium]